MMKSGGAGMRAMAIVAHKMFGPDFQWDHADPAGGLDPIIFTQMVEQNGIKDPRKHEIEFRDRYISKLSEELTRNPEAVEVMPGIHEVLEILRNQYAQHATLGLLTGNYTDAVPIKLDAIEVDTSWFQVTAFGDEAPTRNKLAGLALEKYEHHFGHSIPPDRVIVIGDTPRDIACAQANGCIAFAVATGKHSMQQLRAANADYVVEDLLDPTPLLELLDRFGIVDNHA